MTDTLNIRNLDTDTAAAFRAAAGARNMSYPDYLAALIRLHEVIRARADAGDDALQAELVALGLATVTR